MRTLAIEPHFEAWRSAAKQLLFEAVHPDEVLWTDNPRETSLFTTAPPDSGPRRPPSQPRTVPKAFLDFARSTSAHSDPRRWALLYRLLWRLTLGNERHLLSLATDPEVRQMQAFCKAVGRDIHKMHAFVRFRRIGADPLTGREQFVAWFEPEHRIVRLASPFFKKRFHAMDWAILTPSECASWDGHSLLFTAGVDRKNAPADDPLDELWRTYYRSIFNPARLKIRAMQSEMPKKYWKNLPEAPLIADLIADSPRRVQSMLETDERPAKPAPQNAYLKRLHDLNQRETPEGPTPHQSE
jgi:probable DNA metabolism protein